MIKLPVDWASVDWVTVGILSGLAFLAASLANLMSFGHRLIGSFATAVLFAVFYIVWTYYIRSMIFGPPQARLSAAG